MAHVTSNPKKLQHKYWQYLNIKHKKNITIARSTVAAQLKSAFRHTLNCRITKNVV